MLLVASCTRATAGPRNAGEIVDPDQSSERGDAVKAREEWFMRGRRVPGQNPAMLRERAFRQKQAMMRKPAAQAAPPQAGIINTQGAGPVWQAIGPRPLISDPSGSQSYGDVSGRVTAIAVDQSDPTGNTVYAAGAYGGVWKTTNATASPASSVLWTALTDDQATLAVNAIAISPDGKTVLVGTGEPNNAIDSYYGLGILRSTQSGAPGTWTLISTAAGAPSFHGLGVSKIAFSTNNPAQVVAGISHTSLPEGADPGNTVGIYFSINGGASLSLATMNDGSTPGSVSDVVFDPVANVFYAAVRYHGFYQSSDGGASWSRMANQPDPTDLTTANCPAATSFNCAMFRGQLAVNPATHELFAWFVTSGSADKGIWATTSSSSPPAWTQINDSGITSCGDGAGCGTTQGFYDLYLSAVPNGSGTTDLYAGAVNLYKSVNRGAFANLTHVYGCNPLNMHPDYHAQDFLRPGSGAASVIYFGNDGGIYRSLTGGTNLTGSCTAPSPNPIASLNDGIGSLTQFISFSQHPTNASIIIGGTQDNGSPGTATAGGSTTWAAINLGDGGFNEIDPVNPLNLYTSNTDVTIQHCAATSGDPICEFLPFNPVVNISPNGPVNFPDHGDFYTPYILDPANTGKLIIGTCRVWRGSATQASNWSSGSFANALTNKLNLGNGAAGTACTSGESSYVSALAAGGPATAAGSQVIYAGMTGGFSGGQPVGGTIWVTTNAAGGAATWVDRTGNINPNHFNISSIAIDPADPSGQSAYITIMGFTGGMFGHVYKTSNAGASWVGVSGALPDAPADSIVIDPTNHNDILVGTDVGVFRSLDGGNTWNAFGQGFPNVVVNKLRIFNSAGVLKLRASTHGRGVWQVNLLNPDYTLSISNPLVEVFPSQAGTFFGSLTAVGGYNSNVTIACQPGSTAIPSGSCAPNPPGGLVPSGPFQVSASDATPQDLNFNIVGTGSDPSATTHSQAVTLRIVDYQLSVPSPGSLTVYPNTTSSPPAAFTVSAQGQFNLPVTLSCGGLPPNTSCNFSPSNVVTPAPGTPANVTVTVTASTQVVAGNYAVSVIGTVNGAPAAKSVPLNVIIPDFTLAAVPTSQTVFATSPAQTATFNGTLTSLFGYSSSVALSCIAGQTAPPSICNIAPPSATPSSGGALFAVTAGDPNVKDFSFNIQGAGTDPGHNVRIQPVVLRVVDFSVSALSPSSITMPQNSVSQPINFQLTPLGSFNGPITLTCNGLPAGASCSFNGAASPASLNVSGSPLPVSLVVTTGTVKANPYTFSVTASATGRPAKASDTQQVALTVIKQNGSTDLSVTDGAPEAVPVAHPVGAPLTFTLNVNNAGTAVTQGNAYINFSEPVDVQSAFFQSGAGPLTSCGASGTLASLTCSIGSMGSPGSATVTVTVVPTLVRAVTLTALVNSELQDTNLSNNIVSISRQVRVRPLSRQNLPAKLP